MKHEMPLFSHWYDVTGKILDRASRFPKGLRPTLGHRWIDRALDVMDLVVQLRYSGDRRDLFRRANLALEQMRVLTRLCFDRRAISVAQYGEAAEGIDACGRMLGGWNRSEGGNEA